MQHGCFYGALKKMYIRKSCYSAYVSIKLNLNYNTRKIHGIHTLFRILEGFMGYFRVSKCHKHSNTLLNNTNLTQKCE